MRNTRSVAARLERLERRNDGSRRGSSDYLRWLTDGELYELRHMLVTAADRAGLPRGAAVMAAPLSEAEQGRVSALHRVAAERSATRTGVGELVENREAARRRYWSLVGAALVRQRETGEPVDYDAIRADAELGGR